MTRVTGLSSKVAGEEQQQPRQTPEPREEQQGTSTSRALEKELKALLDDLDAFQNKVEASEDDDPALRTELEHLLQNLDAFQEKLEAADDREVQFLHVLLLELQEKMSRGEQQASEDLKKQIDDPMSELSNKEKKNANREEFRTLRANTAEEQLELYRTFKSKRGWNSNETPQAVLVHNVIARKQEKKRGSWKFLDTLFGRDEDFLDSSPSAFLLGDTDSDRTIGSHSKRLDKTKMVAALQESNKKLRDTVAKLESRLVELEQYMQRELGTYQKVIVQLQKENIHLHYEVEALRSMCRKTTTRDNDLPLTSSSLPTDKERRLSSDSQKTFDSPSLKEPVKIIECR